MKTGFARWLAVSALTICIATLGAHPAQAEEAGKVCKLAIAGNDMMRYDKTSLNVAKDCVTIEVTLRHTGKLPLQTMGHNWALVKTSDLAAVDADGLAAGLKNDWIKPGDTRVIAHTKVIGGGQSTSVTFPLSKLKPGESYSFLCTYPGHSVLMKGVFTIG